MSLRIDYVKAAPAAIHAMRMMEKFLRESGVEKPLQELVKVRASQINGCAYCIDMHTKDARAAGETEQRLYGLSAWRETPYYTDRERVALEWTEAVTLIAQDDIDDELYAYARTQFGEEELVALTFAIAQINAWNRIAISFRQVPGTYRVPVKHDESTAAAEPA